MLDYHKKLQTSRKSKLKKCLAFDISNIYPSYFSNNWEGFFLTNFWRT